MADNLSVTPGTGADVAADDVDGVLHQRVKLSLGADGAATDALGGAGAVAAGVQRVTLASDDPAVAALSAATPAGTNNIGHVGGTDYETVAASQTDQALGATGAAGDYLSHLLIVPATTGAGNVSIKDGAGSAIPVFVSGTLPSLVPFTVALGAKATGAGWSVTTGANVSVLAFGDFT